MIVGSFIHNWFGFPDGSVLTNLVASGICVGFGIWRLRRKLHKHLEKVERHLDQMHDHVLDLHRYHGVETTKHEQ